jgi:NADH-quinone oxidoreductase subunit H
MDDGSEMTSSILAAGTIGEYFTGVRILGWELSESVALVIAAIIHASLLMALFGLAPFFFIWAERKVSGRIQDRLGPTRVGGKFGWLQSLADGIKLIQKEDLCPDAADKMLFRLAPFMVCVASFGAFMVLPFSDGWVAVASDVGLFLLLAILSLEVFGIVLAGYSSGSKWSLFGGMREAAQMVSYEIPLAISALVPVVALGTLNLGEIGRMQQGWFVNWMIFHDPFTFIAFFVYFTVATAGCKRAPFDLAEAESELVGGFHTEYSGMRWSFFFLAEYASMFLVSTVAALLFLGGWYTGFGPLDDALLGLRDSAAAVDAFSIGSYLANLLGMLVLIVKASLLVCVQIWVRWTLPRLRIDQVMMTCLKYLVPISCFLFLGAVLWPLVLVMTLGRTTVFKQSTPLGEFSRHAVVRHEKAKPGPAIRTAAATSDTAAPAEGNSR